MTKHCGYGALTHYGLLILLSFLSSLPLFTHLLPRLLVDLLIYKRRDASENPDTVERLIKVYVIGRLDDL